MTGSIHITDEGGHTTHTWDTTDPQTIQEIEEVLRKAQADGRLVYTATGSAQGAWCG
jgi:hypothetical protein